MNNLKNKMSAKGGSAFGGKISISYPPLESKKGIPCLSQNRQFQWFNIPTFIYPVIPAYAASLLKKNGYEVFWDDAIAEELTYAQWKARILKEKPDIIAIETKTPVVKMHWKIIDELKNESLEIENWKLKIILMGDHVTARPEESLKNSKVDFVIASGDFDFMLLNLANYLTHLTPSPSPYQGEENNKLEGGFYYRNSNGEIINSGPADISKHNLDLLPLIDRELTKWKLYAYKNGNFKYTPGAYMMSGRDCWWGKCTFCLTGDAQILTVKGVKNIKDIKKGEKVLTHLGNYKTVNKTLQRNYDGALIEIKANCLIPFKITPNHKILSLSKSDLVRCHDAGQWAYTCKSNNTFSKRLNCENCRSPKPYLKYEPLYKEAGQIEKGDYLAVPINRKIIKTGKIDLRKILSWQPTVIETGKKIKKEIIKKILAYHKQGESERNIAALLEIDRETVHRYLILEKNGFLENKTDPIKYQGNKISFEGGKKWIPAEINLDKDVFRLFGYYLAEGCVSKLKNRPNSLVLGFTFNQKETDYIDDVRKILKKYFETEINIHQNKANHTSQITVGNTLLAKVFENLFGNNCYNKSLPEFIIYAEREKQVELLRGIFRGDAHYRQRNKRGEYILSSAADNLSAQLVMILLRCSAIPSVRKSKIKGKMTKSQNVITLSSVDISNVFKDEKLEIKQESIYKKGFIVGNYAYLPVVSLKSEKYKGAVYNLSVEDDHSYTVNFAGVSNCSWTTMFPGQKFRTMSAEKALAEVKNLIKFGVKEIMEDSGSLPVGQWLIDFCNGMIERGYNKKITMSCNMRITGIKDLATWKLMKKAGFRFILFGLESASQETLDKICKNLKVEEIEPGLKLCKDGGLEPHITAMIGYPWETKEMAKKTISLAADLFKKGFVDTLQGTIVIPYPGTPLYKYCEENGLLLTKDYERYDQREMVMKSPLTSEDAQELVQELYKSFISPQFILRKLLSIRSFADIKFLFKAGWKWLGKMMDYSKNKKDCGGETDTTINI